MAELKIPTPNVVKACLLLHLEGKIPKCSRFIRQRIATNKITSFHLESHIINSRLEFWLVNNDGKDLIISFILSIEEIINALAVKTTKL